MNVSADFDDNHHNHLLNMNIAVESFMTFHLIIILSEQWSG